MPIQVKCVDCGEKFKVKDELAGRRVKCRLCGVPIRVPEEVDAEEDEDELPISKKKAKQSSAGKRKGGQSGISATMVIRIGIGLAAALVVGLAVWAISGKMASNAETTKANEEIEKKNAANAAADAAGGAPAMPGMNPASMPGMNPSAMPQPGMATPGTAAPGMAPQATPMPGGTAVPMPVPMQSPMPMPGIAPPGAPATM